MHTPAVDVSQCTSTTQQAFPPTVNGKKYKFSYTLKEWNMLKISSCHLISICF